MHTSGIRNRIVRAGELRHSIVIKRLIEREQEKGYSRVQL